MASFYGLNIAKSGLYYSQSALNLTGHNIANVNTAGYTRQRLIGASLDPASNHGFLAPSAKGKVGGGTTVQALDQIRNSFIDRELRREYAGLGLLASKTDTLVYVESIFNETVDSSLSSTMADFLKSLNALSNDAASGPLRTSVRQNAIKMTEAFSHYHNQLLEVQKTQNDAMVATVDRINNILADVAQYNKQIDVYELSGERANDLKDKRNLLIDELSQLVDISYSFDDNSRMSLFIGGQLMVRHQIAKQLVAVPDHDDPVTGLSGLNTIYIDGTNNEAALDFSGGELEAYRQMRDGNSAVQVGIPRIIDQLNQLARSLAEQFNAVHRAGYIIPHVDVHGVSRATGDTPNFFAVPPGGYATITAANFSLSDEILADSMMIAASTAPVDLAGDNPQQGNNLLVLSLIGLFSREDIPQVGNFEAFLKDTIVEVSVESGHVQRVLGSQSAVVSNLENRKQSVSGVSIDEEVTMMIQFQHAYAASSRMITAIDEALDVLINRTGLAGRT